MTPAKRRRQARMRAVIEAHEKGWSLRAIGAHLGVSHETVRRDLASQIAVPNVTPAVTDLTAKCDSNVVQLRRAG